MRANSLTSWVHLLYVVNMFSWHFWRIGRLAVERRFQPLTIKEPTVEQTLLILKAIVSKYENHHGVNCTQEALEAAAKMSERYINDRFLPDKAIDLLDEAGALVHMDFTMDDDRLGDDAYADHDTNLQTPTVTEHSGAQVVSEWTSIPLGKLESDEMQRLLFLEDELTVRVKGQQKAVGAVATAVRRARSGLRDPKRPIASFMFCGPTETGKVSSRYPLVLDTDFPYRKRSQYRQPNARRNFAKPSRRHTLDRRRIWPGSTCRNIWRSTVSAD